MPHRWITKAGLLLLHEQSQFEHGGAIGIRDEGLLDSALARPRNIHAYRPEASISELAAAYAFGIAKNHPFVDGNKRAAFAALGLFLLKNGRSLNAPEAEATLTIIRLAASELTEAELSIWIERYIA
jgi:death on curing protein